MTFIAFVPFPQQALANGAGPHTYYVGPAGGTGDCAGIGLYETDGTDDYAQISAALTDARSGDTVYLCPGNYYLGHEGCDEYDCDVWYDPDAEGDTLTIEGAGADVTILDGGDMWNLLAIGDPNVVPDHDGASVQVSGITFQNGSAGWGAAILAFEGDTQSHVTIRNSVFTGNTALGGSGGAVHVEYGTLVVTDSTFTENQASVSGGALYASNSIEVTGSTFSANTTNHDGGAIFAQDSLQVSKSVFTDNHAEATGGAMRSEVRIDVDNSIFSDNSSEDDAGAIFSFGDITVSDSRFERNIAAGSAGGAIYALNALTVTDSTFTSNEADGGGGAIFLNNSDDASEISGSIFRENSAVDGWGGAIVGAEEGSLTISRSSFRGNAAAYGGAIDQNGTDFSLQRVSFTRNEASLGGGALAIGTQASSRDLAGLSFSGNRAPTRAGRDVMLYVKGADNTERRMKSNKRVWVHEGVRKSSVKFVDLNLPT